MKFPLLLVDFSDKPEIMRINPDASVTVLDWNRVIFWATETPNTDTGFLIAFCQVLLAARYNFVETSLAESDAMGETYRGVSVINVKGEHPGMGNIYGMTEDFVWQVNWKLLETIYQKILVTPEVAATVGFLNLFFAARDNFVTAPIDEVVHGKS
jgi:hypothetical protein